MYLVEFLLFNTPFTYEEFKGNVSTQVTGTLCKYIFSKYTLTLDCESSPMLGTWGEYKNATSTALHVSNKQN